MNENKNIIYDKCLKIPIERFNENDLIDLKKLATNKPVETIFTMINGDILKTYAKIFIEGENIVIMYNKIMEVNK